MSDEVHKSDDMGLSTLRRVETDGLTDRQTDGESGRYDGHAEVCELGMGELPRDLRAGTKATGQFTYLGSGGKVGDKILAEVTCDKFGNKLAYTTIKFTNKEDELVARGSHTKYIAQAFRDPRNIIEQKKS
ncbi:TPA_exp: hypothetical protein A8136_5389 [Trichophyton benhamiae CBS 112371]|nr:TPA_exp: hypothetical protein A8136_5389 [Trichophyton benhamiae CBS 112371]